MALKNLTFTFIICSLLSCQNDKNNKLEHLVDIEIHMQNEVNNKHLSFILKLKECHQPQNKNFIILENFLENIHEKRQNLLLKIDSSKNINSINSTLNSYVDYIKTLDTTNILRIKTLEKNNHFESDFNIEEAKTLSKIKLLIIQQKIRDNFLEYFAIDCINQPI